MTKIIGIDLDEVLAETVKNVLHNNNYKIGNFEMTYEEIVDYYIHNIPGIGINVEDSVRIFKEVLFVDFDKYNIEPTIGSKEKLLELKNNGYKLKVITARREDLFKNYTDFWLEKHFPGILSDVYYANHFSPDSKHKSEICKELGVNLMIEDNPDYALELAQNGVYTLLLEKPWNKHLEINHENIKRVSSWGKIDI